MEEGSRLDGGGGYDKGAYVWRSDSYGDIIVGGGGKDGFDKDRGPKGRVNFKELRM